MFVIVYTLATKEAITYIFIEELYNHAVTI